jgi:AcrR family transcriptional regulator
VRARGTASRSRCHVILFGMPTTRVRERKDPAERRHEIIEAAIEVFGRQGYRQGSLRDVADAVGLSVQGVLHHFATKEALLSAALEQRNVDRSTRIDEIRETQGIVALMRVLLAENLEHPGLMRLYVTLSAEATDPEHPSRDYFLDRYRRTHDMCVAGFQVDVSAGRAPADLDPEMAATGIVALSDGLQLQYLLRPGMDLLAEYDRLSAAYRP